MKHLYYPKTFFKLSVVFLLMLALFILHSCKKDSTYQEVSPDAETLQAKTWFDSTYPVNATNNNVLTTFGDATNYDLSRLARPDWKHTANYSRFNKDVIEMPVDPAHQMAATLKNDNASKAYSNKYSKTSFLIIKSATGYHAYLMTIIADSAYLKGDLRKLARNTYSKRDSDFSGLVLYFNPKGKYLCGYAYKNGHLLRPSATGIATQSTTNPKLKVNDTDGSYCMNWYLNTYIDGELVDSQYMYTTCDGYGGGGTASPPAECPANSGTATGAKLQAAEDDGAPADGLPPDGGGFPDPTTTTEQCPVPIITNNVKDSCLRALVQNIINNNIEYETDAALQSIFNTNSSINLNFLDGNIPQPTNGIVRDAVTTGTSQGALINGNYKLNLTITLNLPSLQNASQEYITATIIHEAIHAYLDYTKTITNQHLVMATSYIQLMANTLISMYGISPDDATALAWGGLEDDAGALWTDNMAQFQRDVILNTNNAYITGTKGTKCHKTP